MKQTLDDETRKAVVDYRLSRSRETLDEMRPLAEDFINAVAALINK